MLQKIQQNIPPGRKVLCCMYKWKPVLIELCKQPVYKNDLWRLPMMFKIWMEREKQNMAEQYGTDTVSIGKNILE